MDVDVYRDQLMNTKKAGAGDPLKAPTEPKIKAGASAGTGKDSEPMNATRLVQRQSPKT